MTRQADARARYLNIATQRFSEAGFHGVSLAALARDAGVTKQALLHFFGTKERLYAEVLKQLAQRLTDEIDQIDATDAVAHLTAYFEAHASGTQDRPHDAKLVVRALMDSDAEAKVWPLRPYLDRLVELARQTSRWRDTPPEVALAGVYRLIGEIQYFAISTETLTGMYGPKAHETMRNRFMLDIRETVRAFAQPEPRDPDTNS